MTIYALNQNGQLGNWVHIQRRMIQGIYIAGESTRTNIKQLESIGFEWDCPKKKIPGIS